MTRGFFRKINIGNQVIGKKILLWTNKKILGEVRREQTKDSSSKTNLTLVACENIKQIIRKKALGSSC